VTTFAFVLGLMMAVALWATWPLVKPELFSLWRWMRRDDSITIAELECETCGRKFDRKDQRVLISEECLWWTCKFCEARCCAEIVKGGTL